MFPESLQPACLAIWKKNRVPFLSGIVAGLLSYGFIFTNFMNNHDNMQYTPVGYGVGLTSGRWFLTELGDFVAKNWGGNYITPLFIGVLTVVFFAMAGCILVHMLRMSSSVLASLLTAMCVVFPTVGGTMFYIYTAHYYAFAALLSVLGAYCAQRWKWWGVFPAALCFACSLGIYQAYFPLAVSAFLLILLRDCYMESEDGEKQMVRQWIGCALRYLAALLLGLVLYFALLKFFLYVHDTALSDYKGMNEMGQITLSEMPHMLGRVYKEILLLPFRLVYDVNLTRVIRLTFLACHGFSALLLLWLLVSSRVHWLRKVFSVIILALIPIGTDLMVLMSYSTSILLRMSYSIVCVFFVPLVLLEASWACEIRPRGEGIKRIKTVLVRGSALALSALLSLSIVNYIWQNNVNYMVLYYTNEQTVLYLETLVTQLKSTEGYSSTMPLAIVGDRFTDGSYDNNVYQNTSIHYSGFSEDNMNGYFRSAFLRSYMGYSQTRVTGEGLDEVKEWEEVRKMPCYPDDGSIQIINDILVLKLEDVGNEE